jgi:hypothetical protein
MPMKNFLFVVTFKELVFMSLLSDVKSHLKMRHNVYISETCLSPT